MTYVKSYAVKYIYIAFFTSIVLFLYILDIYKVPVVSIETLQKHIQVKIAT